MWRWSGGHVGSRPATHGSSLPYLVELGVPAISSSGHLCFLTPAVPNREEGWGSKGRCEESPAWSVSPWRQSGRQVLLIYPLMAALPSSCEVSCHQGTVGFSCPSTHPCHNGGVFQASQRSCSCPPGWMV